jgi:hypothetical protein
MRCIRIHGRTVLPALLVLLVLGLPAPAAVQPAQAQQPAAVPRDAYADAAAADLVRLARIRRSMVDRRIESYEATVVERMSAGLGMGIGERLLYRRETASRVHWTEDTVRIEVLGAREVVPTISAGVQVPAALAQSMPNAAFDPVDSEMLLRLENSDLKHPLATGSEAHYRFAAGDSTVIRLPDGRAVRLRELRITPRRQDTDLIAGSFWLDMDTHAVVQAYFRMARPVDSRRGDDVGVPLMPVRMEFDYIAMDYGLWEQRWWLPRIVAAQGMVQFGPFRVPMRFERRYDDYVVTGTPVDLATLPAMPDEIAPRLCRPPVVFAIQVGAGADTLGATPRTDTLQVNRSRRRAQQDSAAAANAVPLTAPPADSAVAGAAADSAAAGTPGCERAFIVSRPPRAELLQSELLPGDIYAGQSPVLSSGELEALAERLRGIPAAPWQLPQPSLQWGVGDGLVRYNRVEGVSVGVRPRLDFGPLWADGELRVGTAGGEVGVQAGLGIQRPGVQARLGGYRRLDAADVAQQPFGLGSSVAALLLGRDDADYFRATGAEVTLQPAPVRRQWYDLRLFAERQRAVGVETDFHLRRLADDERVFRPNMVADDVDQAGATLRLRAAGQGTARTPRWAGELELHGETGDFYFARPALRLRSTVPLTGRIGIGVEGAAGTTFGEAPVQRAWHIGGPATLRGYDFGAAAGQSFWTARGEVGVGFRIVRLVGFSDVGWAGHRDDLRAGAPLRSFGVGASFLDGVMRFDVARGNAPGGWKVHLRLDGVL